MLNVVIMPFIKYTLMLGINTALAAKASPASGYAAKRLQHQAIEPSVSMQHQAIQPSVPSIRPCRQASPASGYAAKHPRASVPSIRPCRTNASRYSFRATCVRSGAPVRSTRSNQQGTQHHQLQQFRSSRNCSRCNLQHLGLTGFYAITLIENGIAKPLYASWGYLSGWSSAQFMVDEWTWKICHSNKT